MNAREAREIADEANRVEAATQYSKIKADIGRAAKDMKYSITWFDHIRDDVKAKLKLEGFTIGDEKSYRNEEQVTITW